MIYSVLFILLFIAIVIGVIYYVKKGYYVKRDNKPIDIAPDDPPLWPELLDDIFD